MAVPRQLPQTRQIRLCRASAYASGWFGCPIGIQQSNKIKISPKHSPYNGKQSGATMPPFAHECRITQQQMHQQPHPPLPLDGIRVMPRKIRQRQSLFDFLEKHFNTILAPCPHHELYSRGSDYYALAVSRLARSPTRPCSSASCRIHHSILMACVR